MKKIIILLSLILLVTGCSNVNNKSYEELLQKFANKTIKVNTYKTGYKYYLPQGMQVKDDSLYNEIIEDENNRYYLYVDVVSYFNKIKKSYTKNESAIYSERISYDDKFGYLEINLIDNNQYLVEIMYNYAKIEVIVDDSNCKVAVLSAINILKSIEYNDSVIANLLGDDVLNFSEEEFDIFNTKGNDDNSYIDSDNYQKAEDEEIPDMDLIN